MTALPPSLTATREHPTGPVVVSCSDHGPIGTVPPYTDDGHHAWNALIGAHMTATHPDVDTRGGAR